MFSMDLPITTPIGDALNRGALKKLEKRKNKMITNLQKGKTVNQMAKTEKRFTFSANCAMIIGK